MDGLRARLVLALDAPRRLRGLLLSDGSEDVIMLAPCHDVHTFGMTAAIDVAFVDAQGKVLASWRDVPPRRRRRCPGAAAALERYAKPRRAWFKEGDYVEVGAARVRTKGDHL